MRNKMAAVIAIAVLFMTVMMPLNTLDASTLSSDDYGISVPGTNAPDEPVYVTIENGKEKSWSVYVVNTSDKYLDVSYNVDSTDSEVKVTSKPSNALLVPQSDTDHKNITSGVFTIAVDALSEYHDFVTVTLTIAVTDITDKSSTTVSELDFLVTVKSSYDTTEEYNKFFGIYPNTLPSPFDSPFVPFIVTILTMMTIAELFCLTVVPRIAARLDKHTPTDDLKKFDRAISILVEAFVLLASFLEGLSILGANAETISKALSIAEIIYVVLGAVTLWKIYQFLVEAVLSRFEDMDDSSIDMTLLPLFLMIGKLVFWVAGTSAILGALGVDLQGILISAGVVSLGITMGAQNVLSQFFSGIVILMTRPFKKGDFLKINDRVLIVRKVKIMHSEFLGWDKDQIIIIPNNVITAATITNLTKNDDAYRLYVYFSVAYGADLKKAEDIMIKAAEECPLVVNDDIHAKPNVRMTGFEDSGIQLRLGATIVDFNNSITAGSMLRMAVYQGFVDNDVEIPYNRLEVTMLNDCFVGEKRPGDTVAD